MSELATGGNPAAASPQLLTLSCQPYFRRRTQQVTQAELFETCQANALLDDHRDDPAFGYRFLAGEAAEVGEVR